MSESAFPPAFAEGVRHFNSGAYFEAHEAFEECLDAVEEDERWDLLVALIQVAVGYHKLASGNVGAARMLSLGAEKLAAFPTVACSVVVGTLRDRAGSDAAALEAGEGSAASLLRDPPLIRLAA